MTCAEPAVSLCRLLAFKSAHALPAPFLFPPAAFPPLQGQALGEGRVEVGHSYLILSGQGAQSKLLEERGGRRNLLEKLHDSEKETQLGRTGQGDGGHRRP